jgi:DNA-binding winged helix-turn-helix (wHTH) protein/tetratricopeptide (TPR) repeat protein
MSSEPQLLRFEPYEIDERRSELRRHGRPVAIRSKPFALLRYLVRNAHRVVSREELLREVWGAGGVEASAVKSAMYVLRRTLDADARDPDDAWIASVPGLGYRFARAVCRTSAQDATRAGAAARGAIAPLDFVEREAEMERLGALCDAALHGGRQIALLEGPPGIGKTRIATELAREAAERGFAVYVGRTEEGRGAPPFWPWAQVLRSWVETHGERRLEELAGDGSRASDLLGLAPRVPEDRAKDPATEYTRADQARFRLLDRVGTFLERASRERPLLLVLEDLHHADSASLELLVFLARCLTRAPLLILGTHRPLETGHSLGRVLREPDACSIPLTGLGRRSVEDILERRLGRKPPAELVERVHEASGGNPMFVTELARALPSDATPPRAIPSRVHDAVWARICECSPACRQLLSLASAGSSDPTLPVLRSALAATQDDAALMASLEEAERSDLITCASGALHFVHGVVREALYERLSAAERMRSHLRLGEAIEAVHGDEARRYAAEVAHHFLESAPLAGVERAVRHARSAAEVATAACAFLEAAELYQRALRVWALVERDDPRVRGELLVALGDALGHTAAPMHALRDTFVEAMELASTHDLPHLLACAAERCATHLEARGCFFHSVPTTDQALVRTIFESLVRSRRAPEVTCDATLHARVWFALAAVEGVLDRHQNARRSLERSLELAQHSADPSLRSEVLIRQMSYRFDDPERHVGRPAELLAWTRRHPNLRFEIDMHLMQLFLALERADRDACDVAAQQLERLERRTGLPSAIYSRALWRALRAHLEGPFAAATAAVADLTHVGSRLHLSTDANLWIFSFHATWAMLVADGSEQLLALYQASAAQTRLSAEDRLVKGRLFARFGRLEEAQRLLGIPRRRAGNVQAELWLYNCALAAETSALVGDCAHAAELYRLLLPYSDRVIVITPTCLGPVARQLGTLASLLGRWCEAEAHFAQASALTIGLRSPVLSTVVDVDRALAFAAHPDEAERRRSERLRRSAERAARGLGLTALAARVATP